MDQTKTNRLGREKSPYLLQHKDNPIWWYAWGEEALAAAKRENKPIFLSIGYSTCYWCHFMEKDSFEKQDVADELNANFISIKVDREERPDVDNIYMTALVALTGQGGWPMSMFLTPEGRPFFGASTVPHESFVPLLKQVAEVWKTDESKIRSSGESISSELAKHLNPGPPKSAGGIDASILESFYTEMKFQFDDTFAGFGGGNKFPRPHVLSALLRYHRRSGKQDALNMAVRTIQAMSRGGIHDLLAGGFHRYSVDPRWDIPHFEKMLYDNAGLAVACLEAFQVTGDAEFARVARQTLDWVLAEMSHPGGGYYSAQDAGEFDEEGDYYAWTQEELTRILSEEEFSKLKTFFQITPHGNFEDDRNVFHVPDDLPIPDENDAVYAKARQKLLEVRAKREHPRLDDKILTDWNGLMIAAMARGHQVLGDAKYLASAQKTAAFIQKNMSGEGGRIHHRWRDGEAAHRALLDDYAFLIHGLLELYQSDFNRAWFDWTMDLQDVQDRLFWDDTGGAYFFDDAHDPTLILRSKDFEDMAIPSGNSVSALNLLRLADFTTDDSHRERAQRIFQAAAGLLTRQPGACPQMVIALDYAVGRSKEIVIAGDAADRATRDLVAVVRKIFMPNKVVALSGGESAGRLKILEGKSPSKGVATAYVCERGLCQKPARSPSELTEQLSR